MRLLILALTLALVGSEKTHYDPVFQEGKTYIYDYEGLILTGLPENGLSRSGLKVNSKVKIREYAQRRFILKVDDLQVKEYNGYWPQDAFIKASKLTQALAVELTKPITFEYSSGRVGNIYAPEDVSDAALNIHRGVLNMLQINIKKTQNIYDLQEVGVQGTCQTTYEIQENKKANRILITKTKDLNNCEEKLMKTFGMTYAESCGNCQQQNKNMRGAASYSYKLKKIDTGTLILQISTQELHQFTPFSEKTSPAIMEARQKLVLADIQSTPASTSQLQLLKRGTVQYQFSSELIQIPVQLLKMKNPETEIVQTLDHLVRNNQQEVQPDAPLKFLQLVQLLRVATHENLEAIWKQYSKQPQYRRWFLDAIPTIATSQALKFFKEKIQSTELTQNEIMLALVTTMQLMNANHNAMLTAADLISISHIRRTPILRKAALLSYGSMVYRYCVTIPVCSDSVLQPLHAFAAEALSRHHEEEMTLALKALGNAGHPASIKMIQKFLSGFTARAVDVSLTVQADAMMALRNIAKKEPRKVQDIALQIFLGCNFHPELRMLACMILFETKPNMGLVTVMADALLKETNLQVASFSYSHMKALARSTAPDLLRVASSCNVAVKLLSPRLDRLSYRYSKVLHVSKVNYNLMAGAIADVFIINNRVSILPTAVIAKIRGYFLGAAADVLEVGVHAENLVEAIKRSRLPSSEDSDMLKIRQIMKLLHDWKALPAEKPFASVYVKLLGQEVAYTELNKKLLDQLIKVVREPGERHVTVKKIVSQLESGVNTHLSKSLLASEIRRIVPTCVGFPMELSLYSVAVGAANVNIQVQFSPPPSSTFNLNQLFNSKMEVKAQVSPSQVTDTIGVMGINTHIVQSSMEVHAKVCNTAPVKFTAQIDWKEKHLKIETAPSEQDNKLLFVRTETYAASRNIEDLAASKTTPLLPLGTEADILKVHFKPAKAVSTESRQAIAQISSEIVSVENMYSAEHTSPKLEPRMYHGCAKATKFGFQVCLDASARNAAFLKNSPLYVLVGNYFTGVDLKPVRTEATIEQLQLEIQAGVNAASKIIRLNAKQGSKEDTSENREPPGTILQKIEKFLWAVGQDDFRNQSFRSSSWSSSSSIQAADNRGDSFENVRQKLGHSKGKNKAQKHSKYSSSSSSKTRSSSSSSSSEVERRRHSPLQARRRLSNHQEKNSHHQKQQSHSKQQSARHRSIHSTSSSSSSSSRRRSSSQSGRRSAHQQIHNPKKDDWRITSSVSSRSSSSSSGSNSKSSNSGSRRQESGTREVFELRFKASRGGPHKPKGSSSSSSSSSSSGSGTRSTESYQQPKFLGDMFPPVLAVIACAIRSDGKRQGYQIATYTDASLPRPKVQILVMELEAGSRWRICADAAVLSPYKAKAELKWGQECQDYKVALKTEIGRFAIYPAVQIKMSWDNVPRPIKDRVKAFDEYVPGAAYMLGFTEKWQKNPSHQLVVILTSTSPRIIDIVIRAAPLTLYYQGFEIPFAIPTLGAKSAVALQRTEWSILSQLPGSTIADACTINGDNVQTFDHVKFKYNVPMMCFTIMAQDCTTAPMFAVLLKVVPEYESARAVRIILETTPIDMIPVVGGPLRLIIGDTEVPLSDLPFIDPEIRFSIIQVKDGLLIKANYFGIEELYFDGKEEISLKITSEMAGKTCGLCGHSDGEIKQEFRVPSGEVAKDANSFGQSWVMTPDTCNGECKLQRDYVELGKEVQVAGQNSKCYSVEPVLQCFEGCSPKTTVPVKVGFHCVPADSAMSKSDYRDLDEKTEDLEDTVNAHTGCTCTEQCSSF
uniref:VtgABIII protein n=1 Tax=Latimeria menadoensis TaxID=106881 RepID=L8BRQ8_LATME|nr:VtgABIII protein [Latimeria menadoensis]